MAMNQDEADARGALLLRDAEEALQRERLQLFWTQWGPTIIGMALMLVIGTGAGVAWREWRHKKEESSTNQLMAIVSDNGAGMTDETAAKMDGTHAAIGWLVRAGTVTDVSTPEQRNEMTKYFDAAARAGDDSAWGLLARWNILRLQMDDEKADPAKLIGEFDDLARAMGNSNLASLPETDAAVIAGERLKDPEQALEYLARADKRIPRSTPMAVMIADLRHLYEIRAQQRAANTNNQRAANTNEQRAAAKPDVKEKKQ